MAFRARKVSGASEKRAPTGQSGASEKRAPTGQYKMQLHFVLTNLSKPSKGLS